MALLLKKDWFGLKARKEVREENRRIVQQAEIDVIVGQQVDKRLSVQPQLRSLEGVFSNRFEEDRYKPSTKSDYLRLYQTYVWVYAAVYAIITNAAKVPLKVFKQNPDSTRGDESTDNPVSNLFNRPNPHQSYFDFIESSVGSLELTGDLFWERDKEFEPTQMYVLRPDWTTIVPDAHELIKRYEYDINGTIIPLEPEHVIHLKWYHPRSELYGLAASQPSQNSVILDLFAIKYQKKFFKDGAMLDMYVRVPTSLPDKEFKRLKEEMQAKHGGLEKAHLMGVLDNNAEIVELGISPERTLLKEQRLINREEVLAAYGVPPIMVGLLDSATFNNTLEQKKAFWENTMMPKLAKLEDKINVEIANPQGFEVEFDLSVIPALQEDEQKKAATAKTAVEGSVLTPNEARERFYGLQPINGGDQIKPLAGGGAPQEFSARASKDPDLNMTKDDYEVSELILGKRRNKLEKRRERIAKARTEFDAFYVQHVNDIKKTIIPVFKDMEARVLRNIRGDLKKNESLTLSKGIVEDAWKGMDKETKDMADELTKINISTGEDFAERSYKSATGIPIVDAPGVKARVNASISKRVKKWVPRSSKSIVGKTLRGRVEGYLKVASSKEHTLSVVTKNIQRIFRGDAGLRPKDQFPWARTVARTETLQSANVGKMEAFKEAGVKKLWIPGGPPDDRETHTSFGALKPKALDFVYQGEFSGIRFPGDPSADVGELVNCRCTIVEEVDDDDE